MKQYDENELIPIDDGTQTKMQQIIYSQIINKIDQMEAVIREFILLIEQAIQFDEAMSANEYQLSVEQATRESVETLLKKAKEVISV